MYNIEEKRKLVNKVLELLKKEYKTTGPFLNWDNSLQLLVAVSLSAQCTDERVNKVTKKLFAKYKSPKDYADANKEELEKYIYSTGFYKNKAKNLIGMGKIIVEKFNNIIPSDFESLQEIPGVGKKTAAIILSHAFDKNISVAVDTHVKRLVNLIGIVESDNVETIRKALNIYLESKNYAIFNEYLITHGRAICVARKPKCNKCVLKDICKNKEL